MSNWSKNCGQKPLRREGEPRVLLAGLPGHPSGVTILEIMEPADMVHRGDVAFRVSVGRDPPVRGRRCLLFEHLEWPSLKLHSKVTLWDTRIRDVGATLSLSPKLSFAGVTLHNAHCEVGCELFALTPTLRHIGSLGAHGVRELGPLTFSPDERFAAVAVEYDKWWLDPGDRWGDAPVKGGVVHWGLLFVHDLEKPEPQTHGLLVEVPEGWDYGDTFPDRLEFSGERTLALELRWADNPRFEFELPAAGTDVLVAPPKR